MRIALLTEYLDGGGSEGVVQRLAGALAQREHAVFVYCLQGTNPIATGPDATNTAPPAFVVREARSFGFDPWLPARLYRWLARDRIEIVHAHNCAALARVFPAAKMLGLPLVHVWHGWPPGPPTRDQRLALQLDRFADAVVVNSQSLRGRLPSGPLRRDAVCIRNGLDLRPYPRDPAAARLRALCGREPGRPLVLSIGNLRPEKGVETLLAAMKDLRQEHPAARLVCVGAVWDRAYWQLVMRRVRELGLEDGVEFPGPCNGAWKLLAAADVFCLSSERESLPNVVLEAMSQRVPIVATAVGDVGRLPGAAGGDCEPGRWLLRHGETGLLVAPGRPEALAAALHQALSDPQAGRVRAARAARDFEQFFSTSRMAGEYERLYARLLRKREVRANVAGARRSWRPRVLMLGPAAPQLGGMVQSIDVLMRSPLAQRFDLERFATTVAGRNATVVAPLRRPQRADATMLGAVRWALDAVLRHGERLAALAGHILRRRVRIVHIHTCSGATFWRNLADLAISRFLGATVVLHIRGGQFTEFARRGGPARRALVRWGLRAANAVITLSARSRADLCKQAGRDNVQIVRNPVEPLAHISRTNTAAQACRILYLAPLCVAKGIQDLLEAARILQNAGERFELIVAGPGGDAPVENWRQKAAALGLSACTRFTGQVRGPAKADLLANANVFVHPSHSEALPNAVLEAAAAGLPIVTTAVGALPEVFGQPGFAGQGDDRDDRIRPDALVLFVPPRQPKALARALQAVLHDSAGRRRMGLAAREYVESHLNPQVVADQIAEVYRACLCRTRPTAARSWTEWLVGHVVYPGHEAARGRATMRELRDLRRIARLPAAVVSEIVEQRLRALLQFAQRELPFYAEQLAQAGVQATVDRPTEAIRRLPVLTKAAVRANQARMTYAPVPGGLQPAVSGGTSGDTLHFFIDRTRQAQTMAARLFFQEHFGVRPGDRRVHLWGSPIELKRSMVRRVRDRLLNEVLLDAFDMSPPAMDAYLARLRAFRPRLIYGYSGAIHLLARHAADRVRPEDFAHLRLVVMTGDEIEPGQREFVRRVFGCPVAAEYGSREVGLIAHECPRGSLHVVSPHVLVEIEGSRLAEQWHTQPGVPQQCQPSVPRPGVPRLCQPCGSPTGTALLTEQWHAEPGVPRLCQPCSSATETPLLTEQWHRGSILCTNLNTRAQPFIRYKLGDVGALRPGQCPCGLPFPMLEIAGARITGFVAMPDGSLRHGHLLAYLFRAEPCVVEFKLHQRELNLFDCYLVVDDRYTDAALERMLRSFRAYFGPEVRVNCHLVPRIPPDASGKRRHVISEVAARLEHQVGARPR